MKAQVNKFSKNAKLNSVLTDIYEQLKDFGEDEIKHYKKEFTKEKDFNTYRIICKTDLHHAASLQEFNKFTGAKILCENLTLKEAYKKLLEYFSEDAGRYFNNWGAAVAYKGKQGQDAGKTSLDGTRAYSCDIFLYYIEQE